MPVLFGCGCFLGRSSGAALLLKDLAKTVGQAGDRCEHGAQDLCIERILGRKRGQLSDFAVAQESAIHEGSLDVEAIVQLLAVVRDYAERCDGIILSGGQRGGPVQDGIELAHSDLVESLPDQRVLDDRVVDLFLAQLGTESGVFGDCDSLIVDEDAGARVLDAFRESFDDRLLFAENLCVRHCVVSPP